MLRRKLRHMPQKIVEATFSFSKARIIRRRAMADFFGFALFLKRGVLKRNCGERSSKVIL